MVGCSSVRLSVHWSMCLSCLLTAAAAACGWFVAERGHLQQILIVLGTCTQLQMQVAPY